VVESHERLGFTDALIISDRAYNGEKAENFHIPTDSPAGSSSSTTRSWTADCRAHISAAHIYSAARIYVDLILVGRNWYVTWMPQDLIDATKN
jgi:hypothetical protein